MLQVLEQDCTVAQNHIHVVAQVVLGKAVDEGVDGTVAVGKPGKREVKSFSYCAQMPHLPAYKRKDKVFV